MYVATVHKYCEEMDMLTMLLRTCKNQIKPVMKLFMYIFYTFPTLPMYTITKTGLCYLSSQDVIRKWHLIHVYRSSVIILFTLICELI